MANNYRSFQGDLNLLSAANLFQLIGLASLSGQLMILGTDNATHFVFTRGKLNYGFSREGHKKIGQILVESKLITTHQLQICLDCQKTSGKKQKLGAIAVENGFLSQSKLLGLFYKQTEGAFFLALTWTEGRFNFADTSPLNDEDIVLDENINTLVLKGLISFDHSNSTSVKDSENIYA
jgi:hypothetical protein